MEIRINNILIGIFFSLFFTTSATSQDNAVSNHFFNFIEENDFKISYVSDDMLQTILKKNKDAYGKELTEVMQSITSLHVVTAYKQNPDKQYNEAMTTMSQTNYTLLFTKKDQVDKFSLFIKKDKSQISEMVLIARDHVDFVILDITGNINLEKIVILGEALHFQGSEFLDQMNLSEKELKKLHID